MVKLRKSYNKLKIILCCVLGAIVALCGVMGIFLLSSVFGSEKEVVVPDNTENYKVALAEGATYSSLSASGTVSGIANIGYMAYVLDHQSAYHVTSVNTTSSSGITQTTSTTKDYKNIDGVGYMVASDITTGILSSAMQAMYVVPVDADEDDVVGAGVYRRTGSGVNSKSTPTTISWSSSSPTYYAYDERYNDDGYYFTYGAYSSEMTVYLLNEETVTSWSDVTENDDGTYTQTYYLDAEKAAYFYQYSMKTNGNLSKLPTFESITITITFDDNYQVLEIVAKDVSVITYVGVPMTSSSTTTTTFTYGEDAIDEAHFAYYDTYYQQWVGELESSSGSTSSTDSLGVLMGVFSDLLTTSGQQFDIQLTLGDSTYYGALFLSVDFEGISGGSDIASSIQAKLALSADEALETQDLYIEYSGGTINCYYSTNFALTVGVSSISSIVSDFTDFINNFTIGGSSDIETYSATTLSSSDDDDEDILTTLLSQITAANIDEDEDGNGTLTINLDVYGISASVAINYTVSYDEDGNATYSFVNATIGGISYNEEEIELSLTLTAGNTTPTHSQSAALDLSVAASDILDLLKAESLEVGITVEGKALSAFLTNLGVDLTDIDGVLDTLGISLGDLVLTVNGNVDIDGLTVAADVTLASADGKTTYLAAKVYYVYDGNSAKYGTAYLNITELLGATTGIKVYCDIADLADTITTLLNTSISASASDDEEEADSSSLATIINALLNLDFGDIISDLKADGTTIGGTFNVDSILKVFGVDIELGDIVLSYTLGGTDEDGTTTYGKLEGSAEALGLDVTVTGSSTTVTPLTEKEKANYLDLASVIKAITGAINGEFTSAAVEVTIENLNTGMFIDGYTYTLKVQASYEGDELNAYASLEIYDSEVGKTDGTIFAMEVYYVYNTNSEDYGTAYVSITNLLGVTCSIKIKCDISEIITNVTYLIEAVAGESTGDSAESAQVANVLSLNISASDIDNLASKVNAIVTAVSGIEWTEVAEYLLENLTGIITTANINGEEVAVSVNAQVLLTALGLGDYISLGTLSASYDNYVISVKLTDKYDSENTIVSATAKLGSTIVTLPDEDEKANYLDIATVIDSISDLLKAESLAVTVNIDGNALITYLKENSILDSATLEEINNVLAYFGTKLENLDLVVTGKVDIDGVTVAAGITLSAGETEYLAADVYYDYDGTAYLSISNIYGIETDIKVYCDIADLADTITTLLNTSISASASDDEEEADSSSLATIISSLLSLDFGDIISDLNVGGTTIGGKFNVDSILEVFGVDIELGDIVLSYTLGGTDEDGTTTYGKLEGKASSLGLDVTVTGNNTTVTPLTEDEKENYLNLASVIKAITGAINGEFTSAAVNVEISGINTGTFIDNYTYTLNVQASYGEDDVLNAYASLVITESGENGGTIFAMEVYYVYDTNSKDYGTAYVSITNLLGVTCSIKIKCDIAEIITNVNALIEAVAGESTGDSTESTQVANALSLNISASDIDNLASKVNAIVTAVSGVSWSSVPEKLLENLTDIITTANINGEEVVVSVDAQVLLTALGLDEEFNDLLTLGDITAEYENGEISLTITDGSEETIVSATADIAPEELADPLTEDEKANYLDLASVIDAITGAINGEFTSAAVNVEISGINTGMFIDGYTYTLNVQASYGEDDVLNAYASLEIYDSEVGKTDGTIFAMEVYYVYNTTSEDYGTAYVSITNLLGVTCSIKIKCDISEIITNVTYLIEAVAGESTGDSAESAQVANALSLDISASDIDNLASKVNTIVTAVSGVSWSSVPEKLLENLTGIITTANINGKEVVVSVNAQVLLTALGLDKVLTLGTLTASYEEGEISLTITDGSEKTIVSATADIAPEELTAPLTEEEKDSYLDIATVIGEITAAAEAVQDIIESQSAYFTVSATFYGLDGSEISVNGEGEVVWNDDGAVTSIAVNLTVTRGNVKTQFAVIYNNEAADSEAFVTIIINGSKLAITRSDISSVQNEISAIVSAINSLSGNGGATLSTLFEESGIALYSTEESVISSDMLAVLDFIFTLIGGESDVANGISKVFAELLGGTTISIGDLLEVVYGDFTVSAGEDGGSLVLNMTYGSAKFTATVEAGDGSYADDLAEQYKAVSTEDSFIWLVYDYIFSSLDSIDISSFLGETGAYSVNVELNGSDSGISALDGVYVDATIAFGEVKGSTANLVKITINYLTIDEQSVLKGSFMYSGSTLYLELTEIYGVSLNSNGSGLLLSLTAKDLKAALQQAISILTSSDLLDIVNNFRTGGTQTQSYAAVLSTEESSALKTTLETVFGILTGIDFSDLVTVSTGDGTTVITAYVSDILKLFNVEEDYVTKAQITLGSGNSIGITLTNNNNNNGAWLTLSGASCKAFTAPDENDYADLSTLADMLLGAVSGESTIGINLDIANLSTGTILDDYTYNISAVISPSMEGDLGNAGAQLSLTIADGEGSKLLALTIYYGFGFGAYDGESYGTAFVNITRLFGAKCDIKVYCDVYKLADSLTSLISAIANFGSSGENGEADTASYMSALGYSYTEIADGIANLEERVSDLIDIVNGIDWSGTLSALTESWSDYLTKVTVESSTLIVDVDLDGLVKAIFNASSINLETTSINLGNLSVSYGTGGFVVTLADYNNAEKTIAELTVSQSDETVTLPNTSDYINLNALVSLINNAVTVAEDIAAARSVYFTVYEAEISVGYETVSAEGEGEIAWNADGEITSVALSLNLSANGAEVEFIFIYDSEDYITLSIGGYVFSFGSSDISLFTATMQTLSSDVDDLMSGEGTAEALTEILQSLGMATTTTTAYSSGSTGLSNDTLSIIAVIVSQLSGKGILGTLFSEILGGTTVKISDVLSEMGIDTAIDIKATDSDGSDVTYVLGGSLYLGVAYDSEGNATGYKLNGELSFDNSDSDSSDSILGASLSLTATAGGEYEGCTSYTDYLDEQLEGKNYESNTQSLIGLVSELILSVFSGNVGDLLSNTYSVELNLDGTTSGIDELAGVVVKATLYYTKALVSSSSTKLAVGTLVRVDIDELTVGSFSLKASIVYNNNAYYVTVSEVNGTTLSDVKVSLSSDSIKTAINSLVSVLSNEAVLSVLSGLFSAEDEIEANAYVLALSESGESGESDETTSTVAELLSGLLSLKFSDVAKVYSTTDGTIISVNVDKILSTLGITDSVGTAVVKVGTSSIFAGLTSDKELTSGSTYWVSLNAAKATSVDTSVNTNNYYDINFIANLISDAAAFIDYNTTYDEYDNATSVNTLYTFYQEKLTASLNFTYSAIDISADITISNLYVTVGIDENGNFEFSLSGYLQATSVSVDILITEITLQISEANYIGITYSYDTESESYYMTLMKNSTSGTDGASYWVMTLDYFIDNLFAENVSDSPLGWLMEMENWVWSTVVGQLPESVTEMSSGLSDPDELYLYSLSESNSDDGITISDYILGYVAYLSGNTVSSYGTYYYGEALNNLGLSSSDDCYVVSLDADALTSGVLSALDIAIMHSSSTGIGGIKAYADISGYVTVSLNLTYSSDYDEVANYFDQSNAANLIDFGYYDGANDTSADYAYWIFGGAKIENGAVKDYGYSEVLIENYVTVYVYDTDGTTLLSTEYVKYGSTVYLYDLDNPEYVTDEVGTQYAVIYVDSTDTSDYPSSVVVTNTSYSFIKKQTGSKVISLTLYNITADDTAVLIDSDYRLLEGSDIPTDVYSGYTLLGGTWYTDEALTEEYTDTTATKNVTLYGRFVRSTVTENGVKYVFYDSDGTGADETTASNSTGEPHYEISSYTNALSVYYEEGTVLVLENEIDGYKVTAIRAEALQNNDNTAERGLQNVIVPANITYVGASAFKNNYGMQTVIFLADEVTLAGTSENDKDYPFYGCSTASGETDTYLTVYFNSINNSSDSLSSGDSGSWNHYRQTSIWIVVTSIITNYYFAAYGADTWAYIDLSVIANDSDYASNDLVDEVIAYLAGNGYSYNSDIYEATGCLFVTADNLTAKTASELKSAINSALTAAIDEYTAEHSGGATGMYSVSTSIVSGSAELGDEETASGVFTITVTVTQTDEKWYAYTATHMSKTESDGNYAEDSAAGSISSDIVSDGKVLGADGATIKVTPATNYSVDSVKINDTVYSEGNANYSVGDSGVVTISGITVDGALAITVYYTKTNAESITVYSAVDFTIGDDRFSSDTGVYTVTLEQAVTAPEATGYYFIGWAYTVGESFVYATTLEDSGTYYAIWADCEVAASGTNAIATPTTTAENYYFLGWAVDNGGTLEFANTIKAINGVYHAIWAVSSREFSATVTDGSSSLPGADYVSNISTTNTDGTFYQWYADGDFGTTATSLSEISNYTVYARWQFTLTVTGTVNQSYYSKDIIINNVTQSSGSYTTTILEGEYIYISEDENDKNKVYYIYSYVDGSNDTLRVDNMRIKTKSSWSSGNNTREITVYLNGEVCTDFGADTRFIVSGDVSVSMVY